MPRKPRVNVAGYHFVTNKGVANRKIFFEKEDYRKFLDILCASAKLYNFNVHSYSLIEDRYTLLVETKEDNLPLSIRYLNSNYAIYFNKKYNRVGHLWKGRYQSWYILNESFLPTLSLYIEHYPLFKNPVKNLQEYEYSSYRSFINIDEPIECLRSSFIFKNFKTKKEVEDFFNTPIKKDFKEIIAESQKIVNYHKNSSKKYKQKSIEEHFENIFGRNDRNIKIYEAYQDGYTQTQIATFLNLSQSTISNSIKKILKNKKSKIICI